MQIQFQIDNEYSARHLKNQIDNIITLLNILYERKLKEDEEDDNENEFDRCKIKKNHNSDYKVDIGSKVELLELPKEETKEETKESDPKIICECGGSFIKRNKLRHQTSKTHKQFVALKNISNK